MNFNIELYLFILVISLGIISLIDILFRAKSRIIAHPRFQVVARNARAFFPVLLVVFSFRSFAFEPRYIPSGSLKPTLLVGDLVLVNKFTYGLRVPVLHTKILSIHAPKRGDIVVFREPKTMKKDLIKRVIGVPGDKISYINKVLYINNQKAEQQFEKFTTDEHANTFSWQVVQQKEDLLGIKHSIYQNPVVPNEDFFNVTVPAGNYFMMGDNRDDSADSRAWGFLPEKNIIGRATYVMASIENFRHPVRLDRIARQII